MTQALSPVECRPSAAHAVSLDALWAAFDTQPGTGLSEEQVSRARARYGFNELAEAPPEPLWKKLAGQFKDLVIWILIVAAIVSGALGEWVDALAILAIVLLNGAIGFFQEERASRALAALQELSSPVARVVREGRLQSVPARELVPGDRIELEAGDNIPADARLFHGFAFRVQEAALTGESSPVDKDPILVLPSSAPLADRRNMVYLGTVAAAGKASAVVVATGMETELGRIAGLLERHEPEPTPLQRRLRELGRVLVVACVAIVTVVFALQLLRGGRIVDVFLVSVSLAVAAVPEGLPAVVTVALALGLQRMVKRNALVRKLPSVETLGSVTVICSDKTGTLTRNEMTVREVLAGGDRFHVMGVGYAPRGQFLKESANPDTSSPRPISPSAEPGLIKALATAALCNNARVAPIGKGGNWQVIGDPTEGALIVAALKAGIEGANEPLRVVYEIPFDSARKAMSVVEVTGSQAVMYTKGAPESVLAKCVAELRGGRVEPLTAERRQAVLTAASEMASRALRVLGLAYREGPAATTSEYKEEDLVFVGLVGMIDPPREEVKEAVRTCRDAGIHPVMITGDHPNTALAVARELGLAAAQDRALTGQDLDAISDDELAAQVEKVAVYARVSAEHKLRVVRAWKRRGQVVAMTGDGVNDAPAVKTADIGIAMGVTGTDVTKEAADMVLTDDNFASIVSAVEEGRGIFDNIQKVLQFLLATNFGEILLMLVASILGWPTPLLPIQLLWINLVTDGLPALALSLEPPEPGIMRRPPRPATESVLSARIAWTILWQGMLVGAVGLAAFGMSYVAHPDQPERARAMAFCVLAYAQLFCVLSSRSQTMTMPELGFFSNPILLLAIAVSGLLQVSVVIVPFAQPVFETAPQTTGQWLAIAALALAPVTIIEVFKLARRCFVPKVGTTL